MPRVLILAGVVLIVLGAALHFAPWLFTWFGRLPGDIRIETARSKVFIPITSMLIVSLILSLVLHFFRR